MARTTIPGLTKHFNLPFSSMPITIFIIVIAILSIFSFVSFLCGSKKGKKLKSMEGGEEDATSPTKKKKLISKLNSNISEKALSLVKMISWRKVDAEGQGGHSLSMASSSSKSPNSNRRWKHDVFLSFRGKDTRNNFTDHLYEALKQKGFITFRDDEELIRGEVISDELLKAIEESLISIVVLSENYASSPWCLDELLKILESRKLLGRTVLPIFYGVDPSAVRYQTGSFKEAFEKHKKRFRDDTDKVQRWRNALKEVADLSGLNSTSLRETELIGKIVEEVWIKLQHELPSFSNGLVGIESKIADIDSLLRMELNDVRFIGIWGMGGIGKITIATVVFNEIRSRFDVCCFLTNVREISGERGQGLVDLQRKLLSTLKIRGMEIENKEQGKDIIRSLLYNRKVLLVLDDVSSESQLENLAKNEAWFGPGSRIIVTTRNSHILTSHGISAMYKIDILNKTESLQLFCQKAFKSNEPPKPHFLELLNNVIQFSGGLPLALKVMGSALCERDLSIWKETLSVLREDPQSDILTMLRISFNGLLNVEKEIFLDIACFFNGWSKYYLIEILGKCGFRSRYGIEALIEKSLITVENDGNVWMHDLLVEMGRNIVYQECPTHACKRSRLWSLKDIDKVFRNNMGTESIQAIVLNLSMPYEAHWNPKVFSKMCNLRLFITTSGLHLPRGLKCLPSGLKVLIWEGYPLESLPLEVPLDELVHLEMRNSGINRLCTDIQAFSELVSLNLSGSKYLTITPNFDGMPNLATLNLCFCTNLVEVDPSIGLHKKLVKVYLQGCINLENLPERLEMSSLKTLSLYGCSNVRKFPEFGENMVALTCLMLEGSGIVELHPSLRNLTGLFSWSMHKCEMLTSLNFSMLPPNVSSVSAFGCYNLKEISLDPSISSLQDGIDFEEDVQTWRTTMTSQCRNQDFQSSTNEEQFNGKDTTTSDARQPREQNPIKSMDLDGMNNNDALECVDKDNFIHLAHSISGLRPKILWLDLPGCSLTDESIPQNLGFFSSLEGLDLSGNDFVNLPNDCISKLLKLTKLRMNNCRSLKSLPKLPPNVKHVTALNCNSMKPPPDQYQQQILSVLAASMESGTEEDISIYLHIFVDLFHQQVTKEGTLVGRIVFRVPGSEIPPWFDNQNYVQNIASSKGKDFSAISITVEIPDNCCKSECWGIAVCLVIQDMLPTDRSHGWLQCKSEIIGVDKKILNFFDSGEHIGFLGGPHLLIVHWHAQDLQFDQTQIQLTFYFDSGGWSEQKLQIEIKKCGYRVFSKEDAEAWRKIMASQCRIEGLQSSNDDEKQLDENDVTSCDVDADQPAAKRTKLT